MLLQGADRHPRLDPLSRLAVRFGSDKFGGHLYTPIYHRLLSHLREEPIALLEIGVGGYDDPQSGGSSLMMWAEYFPFARIVGLDISSKEIDTSPRVTIVRGSQVDAKLLRDLTVQYGPFDVVIDDGSHYVGHVLETFRCLYPRIAADGFYIVEDTQTAFNPGSGGNGEGRDTIFTLAQSIALAMHKREGYVPANADADLMFLADITHNVSVFRNVVVLERGDNSYPSNLAFDLENDTVRRVDEAMVQEAGRNPAPRSALGRIDMAIWGGRPQRAAELALAASEAYPTDVHLHAELVRMMIWAGESSVREQLAARLSRIIDV